MRRGVVWKIFGLFGVAFSSLDAYQSAHMILAYRLFHVGAFRMVLQVRHKTNAASVKEYMRQSDYYLETPGDWLGIGSSRLELTGQARQEDFDALCDNLRPDGSPLTA